MWLVQVPSVGRQQGSDRGQGVAGLGHATRRLPRPGSCPVDPSRRHLQVILTLTYKQISIIIWSYIYC